MKKIIVLMMCGVLFLSSTVCYAKESDVSKVKSIKNIRLDQKTRKTSKLVTIDSNGKEVYGFKDINKKDIKIAHNYIINLTKKAKAQDTSVHAPDLNVEYYGNDTGYDLNSNDAMAYTWGKILVTTSGMTCNYKTWGGTSGYWTSDDFQKMKLHQKVTVNKFGFGVTISWPPSLKIDHSSTSKGWTSELMTINPAATSHEEFNITSTLGVSGVTSVIYQDSADIYLNGSGYIYTPDTYLKFHS
ncbi:hypothetical protein AN1V17_09480 [Vallitalea sediminicola]